MKSIGTQQPHGVCTSHLSAALSIANQLTLATWPFHVVWKGPAPNDWKTVNGLVWCRQIYQTRLVTQCMGHSLRHVLNPEGRQVISCSASDASPSQTLELPSSLIRCNTADWSSTGVLRCCSWISFFMLHPFELGFQSVMVS